MKIFKISIENFRSLKNFSIDLEDDLSLVIGKNNTGKTSILMAIEKFINGPEKQRFVFDDFNIGFKKHLKQLLESPDTITENDYIISGIKLRLFIKYGPTDNLANVSRIMMDLDPDNNVVVLGFEYLQDYVHYQKMRTYYLEFKSKQQEKLHADENYKVQGPYDFLKHHQEEFFQSFRKSFLFDIALGTVNEKVFLNLEQEKISLKEILNFKFISARRDVTNKEMDKTLSGQTSRIYARSEATEEQTEAVEAFQEKLTETDDHLSNIYQSLFKKIIDKVKIFGGVKINESDIGVISTLQDRELLKGNTTVVYKQDEGHVLPEHYNGLGYMNLISMIFEIEILVQEFKREKDKMPADINLLFIEEPEAHTHPQMQYVFIKNIKQLLGQGITREDGNNRNLQYIITTHSSHIVADSDFNDLKYLRKESAHSVMAKNLKDLKDDYDINTKQYQFLTQYLTISRAEIFFAEKAILIEGDTERILIPTLMRKVDIEEKQRFDIAGIKDPNLPLLSQHISVVEVGAYAQIFEKFIDFLGIKTLVITDLDAVDANGEACEVANGQTYSNSALSFFFDPATLAQLRAYTLDNKCFTKVAEVWQNDVNGKLCIVYQKEEEAYAARSFEDAYININRAFITDNKASFNGLKNKDDFDDAGNGPYVLAKNCINKKTHFAMDIIFNSNADFSNWKMPAYINEGLLWLKKD